MQICDPWKCTGCMACQKSCPFNAIDRREDAQGFPVPYICDDKCTACEVCANVCPILNPLDEIGEFRKYVYAAWHRNGKIRKVSSSGGVFHALGLKFLKDNGIVFGAALDNQMVVHHCAVTSIEQLGKLHGSKYVQSDLKNTYREAKDHLKDGKKVLYSGTPCQIAGLKKYLAHNDANLVTIDVVCHGVPSPKVFKAYVRFQEKRFKSTISDIQFRYKGSWSYFSMYIKFESGRTYKKPVSEDPWLIGFLSELFNRPACATCQYANLNRVSDVTLGDFWGYREKLNRADRNTDKGISMVMVNTRKGHKVLNSINKDELKIFSRPINEAVKGNRCLSGSFEISPRSEEFWRDFDVKPFEAVVEKHLKPQKVSFKKRISLTPFGLHVLRPVARELRWIKNMILFQ